jgi:ABC-type Fe3+/spermidine/putrescine transport system ATPase subunit
MSCWSWWDLTKRRIVTRTSSPAASSSASPSPGRWLSALDARVRTQLRAEIRSLQQRLGITTLFVTHDQSEALSVADRVGVMQSGRLEQIGTPEEVYRNPATPFVAEFVGAMNRLPGRLGDNDEVQVLGQRVKALNVNGQKRPWQSSPTLQGRARSRIAPFWDRRSGL